MSSSIRGTAIVAISKHYNLFASTRLRLCSLAIGVSLDKPEADPHRRVAIIDDAGHEIGTVPAHSKPSCENPAK